MTAVEWLAEQIEQYILTFGNLPINVLNKLKKQAKELEKKQIIDFSTNFFEKGAKWQQERSYSEEEVMNILKERDLHNCINMNGNNTWVDRPQWFEQFKKN
jgi:hypothetical protein